MAGGGLTWQLHSSISANCCIWVVGIASAQTRDHESTSQVHTHRTYMCSPSLLKPTLYTAMTVRTRANNEA